MQRERDSHRYFPVEPGVNEVGLIEHFAATVSAKYEPTTSQSRGRIQASLPHESPHSFDNPSDQIIQHAIATAGAMATCL